jgi:hypothetical protein
MDAQARLDFIQRLKADIDHVTLKPSKAKRIKKKIDLLFDEAVNYGIELAASVAAAYDSSSSHPFLVSDCILGKLNRLKGKPRPNETAGKLDRALTRLEKKVDDIYSRVQFVTKHTNRRRSTKSL